MSVGFVSDEYTKITTPRQDVLFKKGYLGRKRAAANPSPCDTQEVHSNGECQFTNRALLRLVVSFDSFCELKYKLENLITQVNI